jgi:1,4-dihydroxy-2-naphthoate octaprenyltransferase
MKAWIEASRLRTLFLSLSCILMGIFLAAADGHADVAIATFAVLTAVFLQVLSNLANDYGDSIHGADHAGRKGPLRAVQSGSITSQQMKKAIVICAALAFVSGIALLFFSYGVIGSTGFAFLFGTGVLAIVAAVAYTNGVRPYGYAGLGDLSVFIFFGLVAVCGTYYLQAGVMPAEILLPAFSLGFFSVGVLNINNMRDIESDKHAGKKSIPVRLGFRLSKIYHLFLVAAGCGTALMYSAIRANHEAGSSGFLYMPTYILFGFNVYKVFATQENQKLDPLLRQLSLTTFLFVVTFGIGLLAR